MTSATRTPAHRPVHLEQDPVRLSMAEDSVLGSFSQLGSVFASRGDSLPVCPGRKERAWLALRPSVVPACEVAYRFAVLHGWCVASVQVPRWRSGRLGWRMPSIASVPSAPSPTPSSCPRAAPALGERPAAA